MNSFLKYRSLFILGLILFIIGLIWFLGERAESFSEPQEALFHWDEQFMLIPADQMNDEALFFFIKRQGGNLIYGLISSNHHMEVNGIQAIQLDLNMVLEKNIIETYKLEEQSLWYFHSDTQLEDSELTLVDSNTNGMILDTYSDR
ncbi:hypothetical protein [Halalkalibacter alkalisediminis]|uniref:Uncharacterized protein n=1 Tax=Halalkalibacter alkalisediminis TaxID=935616 RepID=A0ABV6NA79_9BACI|nr:hypothetical protein [Halalkalibacter alkalisediminis]